MDNEEIYTVKQINKLSSQILRESFSNIYIKGEISGLQFRSEKWTFFELKDETAIIKCVNFSGSIYKYKDLIKDGNEIIVSGYINIYEKTGSYQCNIEDVIILKDDGALFLKIEEIKKRLYEEGLFDEEKKKKITEIPRSIGVITSLEKASMAYKDFVKTIKTRFPLIDIYLYDAKVQGIDAEKDIINGIKYFNDKKYIDIIVLTRGGGSIEDLMTFNSELLAREIYASEKIIVSAVGHEGNISISDLVSDIHAFTPTHAATLVSPDSKELKKNLHFHLINMNNNVKKEVDNIEYKINYSFSSIKQSSLYKINEEIQFLNESFFKIKEKLNILSNTRSILNFKMKNMLSTFNNNKKVLSEDIKNRKKIIDSYNPLNLLSKGYSLIYKDNKIIKSIDTLNINDIIKLSLIDGSFLSKIIKKDD
jgi:exodeoxyribonuclease VII large subunit